MSSTTFPPTARKSRPAPMSSPPGAAMDSAPARLGMLRAILDACPSAIHAKDADGVIVFANHRSATLFGMTPEQLVGKRLEDVHPNKAEAAGYLERDTRVLATGVEDSSIATFTAPREAPRYFQVIRKRILSDSGEPIVLTIATDISSARRAELAAEEMQARWSLTLEGLRDGVWYWDIAGNSVSFSARWKKMLGYEVDELKDTFDAFERLLHPEDRPRMKERLQAHLIRREPYEIKLRMKHRRGEWRWIHVRGQAEWDDAGKPLRMSGSNSDVTEERTSMLALREAIQFLEAIQQNIPLGVFVKSMATETQGQFMVWNDACSRLFERDAPAAIGLTARQVFGDAIGAKMEESDRLACEREVPVDLPPILATSANGIERWMRTLKVPMFDSDGQVRWLLGITEDVSDRLVAESQREAALRRAEDASRIKSQFLANMSHEIRTPMTGVLGLISRALDAQMPPDARDLLESAQTSAKHLLAIIHDILDLSKIEAGKMTLESTTFSLRDVVRDTAVVIAPRADEKELELVVDVAPDVPDLVRGDAVRVRQIITNLAGNAVRFTATGEVRVVVELEPGEPDSERRIVCAVIDSGIGIPEDKLDSIFQPFSQAGMRVLLAEDNPVNTRVATRMMEKLGCVVVHAGNGREALALFQSGSFDAVLFDVQMPEMDGLECARAIRAAEAPGERIPIVALTANAMKGDEAMCLDAGMDSYLSKPIDRQKLQEQLCHARVLVNARAWASP